jgi:HlyD family secretion protein
MNAAVAFLADEKPGAAAAAGKPVVFVPPAAVRDNKALILVGGKVVERAIRTSGSTPQGLRVEDGLIGGEELVLNPPADLKPGARAKKKGS